MNKKKSDSRIAATGESDVNVVYSDENIWLSQKMMGTLYHVDVRTISEHLQKIFKDNELLGNAVIRNFRITASDGKNYNTQHYNLSAIIAAQIVQEFTIKGFEATDRKVLQDAGKVTAEIAKAHAETEFEKYRVIQDQLFESDFDKEIKRIQQKGGDHE